MFILIDEILGFFIYSFYQNLQSMIMLFIIIMLGSLTMSPIRSASSDNTLRLYDSFAELHQEYTEPLRFEQADWDNIKHESIILRVASDNTPIPFERRIVRINANMTGF
jgi:hypothetical protein